MRKRRTEIVTETLTLWLVKSQNTRSEWCDECLAGTPWLEPRLAACLAGTTTRRIYCLIKAGAVHFKETNGNEPIICACSLMKIC